MRQTFNISDRFWNDCCLRVINWYSEMKENDVDYGCVITKNENKMYFYFLGEKCFAHGCANYKGKDDSLLLGYYWDGYKLT